MNKICTSLLLFLMGAISLIAQVNKVLVIGIDGCRPDGIMVANTPNIDALIANASYSMDAQNTDITSSGPGWSAMMTGVWSPKHGVTDNSFGGSNFATYPHFFKRVEDHDPNLHTVSICQWHPVNNFIASPFADTTINVLDNTLAVRDAAIVYLTLKDPDAMMVHFDDVDHAGHGSGFTPTNPNYISAIEDVDAGIGAIMTALNGRPNIATENWAIILSTDHGGIGFSHGGTSPEERRIFVIVSGDSIPNLAVSRDSTIQTIPPVMNCLGDSVELYFDGTDKVNTTLDSVYRFGSSQDFSIECRVRTTTAADVAIVTDKDWDSGTFDGWVFSFAIGTGEWKVNVGDGSNRADVNGNLIDDGEWHTLSATFDRDGMLVIYEDGVAVDSTSIAGIGDINSGHPISFGADADDEYEYNGYLSEVRIFDTLISKTDIVTWNCTKLDSTHNTYANLIGYWPISEGGASPTVFDQSPTGADGTLAGPTWENALDTTFSWSYDYSNTPRTVDVAVSALEHLCIPIDSAWNLDGKIFGTDCDDFTVGLAFGQMSPELVQVYPNPSTDKTVLSVGELNEGFAILRIFDATGKQVLLQAVTSNEQIVLEKGQLRPGIFFFHLQENSGTMLDSGKFVRLK